MAHIHWKQAKQIARVMHDKRNAAHAARDSFAFATADENNGQPERAAYWLRRAAQWQSIARRLHREMVAMRDAEIA